MQLCGAGLGKLLYWCGETSEVNDVRVGINNGTEHGKWLEQGDMASAVDVVWANNIDGLGKSIEQSDSTSVNKDVVSLMVLDLANQWTNLIFFTQAKSSYTQEQVLFDVQQQYYKQPHCSKCHSTMGVFQWYNVIWFFVFETTTDWQIAVVLD